MTGSIAAMGLVIGMSAFATEFNAKIDDVQCRIVNNTVTRTQTFGKDVTASFTETKKVSISGMEELAYRVAATSTQTPTSEDGSFRYTMSVDGKPYHLNVNDSKESMILVRMITKLCR